MTIKQRIISFLQNHLEGVDDDELAMAINLTARQQANMRCRELEKEGLVIRRQVNGKIHNFWAGKDIAALLFATPGSEKTQDNHSKFENWFWEGNVQSEVINSLTAQGYQIRSVADTVSHQ